MSDLPAVIGVVLAGGRSRRMGSDKAALTFRGRTLLDHMLDRLRAAGLGECVVSGTHATLRCVADLQPDLGPVAALQSLAEALPDRRLLIVAVDTPRLPIASLLTLRDSDPDARCVHFQHAPLPLRIDTDAGTREVIAACLAQSQPNRRSLHELLNLLGATALPLPVDVEREALAGCNTPQEWQDMLERGT